MGWLESLWHFVFGWPSVAFLIGAAAAAIAVFEPKQLDAITDLRKWAIVVAIIAFSFTAIAGKYYHDGIAELQRQWSESLAKEAHDGAKILDDAERDAGSDTPDRLRNDSWNRDLRNGAPVH
jgi:hypothetical protein